MLLVTSTKKKLLEYFTRRVCKKRILRVEKVVKKAINYMLNGKVITKFLTVGLIKKSGS